MTDALASTKYVAPSCRKADLSRGKRHLGNICDALSAAGIDPTRWTAAQVVRRLDLQAHSRGWTWPTTIANPGAYLRWRLSQLDWTAPPEGVRLRHAQIDAAHSIAPPEHQKPPASDERRRAHYAAIAKACGWRRTDPRQEVSSNNMHHH